MILKIENKELDVDNSKVEIQRVYLPNKNNLIYTHFFRCIYCKNGYPAKFQIRLFENDLSDPESHKVCSRCLVSLSRAFLTAKSLGK